MSIKNVQLLATITYVVGTEMHTRPATPEESEEDECLWSVYVGEPGDFSWLADFVDKIDAEFFANHLCALHSAVLIEGGA